MKSSFNKHFISAAIMALGIITHSAHAEMSASTDDVSTVLATVNGKPITQQMYSMYASKRGGSRPGAPSPNAEAIINSMVVAELLAQEAQKQGIDQRDDVKITLAWQRRSSLANLTIQEYIEANPISDADMQKTYDEQVGKTGGDEYHARHILVKTADEAKAIITELDKGADFAELAKEKSTGPTGKQGGDLGWFTAEKMVKAFSNAVMTMEKGSYSKTPVETQFGQHVIYLEDTRAVTPPPFAQVKPQIQKVMQSQQIEAYINDLKSKANIVIK